MHKFQITKLYLKSIFRIIKNLHIDKKIYQNLYPK